MWAHACLRVCVSVCLTSKVSSSPVCIVQWWSDRRWNKGKHPIASEINEREERRIVIDDQKILTRKEKERKKRKEKKERKKERKIAFFMVLCRNRKINKNNGIRGLKITIQLIRTQNKQTTMKQTSKQTKNPIQKKNKTKKTKKSL